MTETNLIGIMSSNEDTNVKLTSNVSPSYGSNLYNLFDGIVNPYTSDANVENEHAVFFLYSFPVIINIQFKNNKYKINQYSITSRDRPNYIYYPSSWTFEGSVDNINWSVLDTEEGIIFGQKETKIFSVINSSSYNFYRINIKNEEDTNALCIGEMQLLGYCNKFLIKQDTSYYSIKPDFYQESDDAYIPSVIDGGLLSKDSFTNYGIDDLSSIHYNALNKLIDNKYNIAMMK